MTEYLEWVSRKFSTLDHTHFFQPSLYLRWSPPEYLSTYFLISLTSLPLPPSLLLPAFILFSSLNLSLLKEKETHMLKVSTMLNA